MKARIQNITLGGTLASSAACLILSRIRTGSYGQGVNCTAHWLHGNNAAQVRTLNKSHSLVGIATNAAAVLFWGWFYSKALGKHPGVARALLVTAAVGPVSCLVDYKATPKRFTPGWELVFSRIDMALIYAAMVTGMGIGALCTRKPHQNKAAA